MKYVAFLRGINLGKRRPAMSRLREIFEEMGFQEVADLYRQRQRPLHEPRKKTSGSWKRRIARQLEESLGYPVDTFIRTAEEVRAIDQARVFGEEVGTVHVGFLHEKLPAKTARTLEAMKSETDEFRVARPRLLLALPRAHERLESLVFTRDEGAPAA